MRLSDWARIQGIHDQIAWKCAYEGKMPLPVVKTATGRYLVFTESAPAGGAALYARVSPAGQKPDLDRQGARLAEWATGNKAGCDPSGVRGWFVAQRRQAET